MRTILIRRCTPARARPRACPKPSRFAIVCEALREAVGAKPLTSSADSGLNLQVVRIATEHGSDVSALERAAAFTADTLTSLQGSLHRSTADIDVTGLDVIFCGSAGRGELTSGSDTDYFVLLDANIEPLRLRRVTDEVSATMAGSGLQAPGNQGLFADIVIAAELQARIGLASGSHVNMTRRLLILMESVSLLTPNLRAHVIEGLLSRYCVDHNPEHRTPSTKAVPRFLLNDVLRYWRTITVDFGAKQWSSTAGSSSYPRYAKLLTSRKVLIAGALAMLFTCHLKSRDLELDASGRYTWLVEHLKNQVDLTPLARLASLYDYLSPNGQRAMASLIDAYNHFMAIMNSPERREALKSVGLDETEEYAALKAEIEEDISAKIQGALIQIFFKEEHIVHLTEEYGLF